MLTFFSWKKQNDFTTLSNCEQMPVYYELSADKNQHFMASFTVV